jgi:hypothetical protein
MRARHGRAFAHHVDNIEALKASDDSIGIGQMVIEHGDGRAQADLQGIPLAAATTTVSPALG